MVSVNEFIRYFSDTNLADVLEKLVNAPVRKLITVPRCPVLFRVQEEDLDEIVALEVRSVSY
jgi:hypothetical protein